MGSKLGFKKRLILGELFVQVNLDMVIDMSLKQDQCIKSTVLW